MDEAPSRFSRIRRIAGRVCLAGVVVFVAWSGWRVYDEQAAIREAKAAGCTWKTDGPIERIRRDGWDRDGPMNIDGPIERIQMVWHVALRKETWTGGYRKLDLPVGADLTRFSRLIHRLRPTELGGSERANTNLDALKGLSGLQTLCLGGCTALQAVDGLKGLSGLQTLYLGGCTALQAVDGLKGLTRLEYLTLNGCPALQNVDALKGLSELQTLHLEYCTALQNVDGLKGLSRMRELYLIGCTALQNVDGLKGLSSLHWVNLNGCTRIPPAALRELAAALPHTAIIFPDGTNTPPP